MVIDTLEAIAMSQFSDLSSGEQDFLRSVEKGDEFCAPTEGSPVAIRADVLGWLCSDVTAATRITARGIQARRLRIEGRLDLRFVAMHFPLGLQACVFDGDVDLQNARFLALTLMDCTMKGLSATRLHVDGALVLTRTSFAGPVELQGCQLDGNLRLHGARIVNAAGRALNLENASVGGSILMTEGFHATGQVWIFSARIQKGISCDGTIYSRRNATGTNALVIELSSIGASVLLRRGFRALGGVRIFDARIGGSIDMQAARLIGVRQPALYVYATSIDGSLLFCKDRGPSSDRRALARGPVFVEASSIAGNVDFSEACIRTGPHDPAASRGASFFDSVIKGRMIARGLDLQGRLILTKSRVANDLQLADARICSPTVAVVGAGLDCGGNVYLERATLDGPIDFHQARIADDIRASKLTVVVGDVEWWSLFLVSARIGGTVDLRQAALKTRLMMNSTTIGSFLQLNDAAIASIEMPYASVGSNIILTGTTLSPTAGPAILMDYARCGGSIFSQSQFTSTGTISMNWVSVQSSVLFEGATFAAGDDVAFDARFSRIGGHVMFRASTAGLLRFSKAVIGGSLEFSGSSLDGRERYGLNADSATISGDLRLTDHFHCGNGVSVRRGSVGGSVHLGPCQIVAPPDGSALTLAGTKIEGELASLFGAAQDGTVWETHIAGELDLARTTISGDVDLSCATLLNEKGTGLSLHRAVIRGVLYMTDRFRTNGAIDLRGAEIHGIEDHEDSWPGEGNLHINGLIYANLTPLTARKPIDWVERQPLPARGEISWQPYEQLAKVLRQQGREGEAHTVMIAKERASGKNKEKLVSRLSIWAYGRAMGFGYRPQRAAWLAVPLIIFGTVVFSTGGDTIMVPTNDVARREVAEGRGLPHGYPRFDAVAYSADMLIPIVSLQQKDSWRPASDATCVGGPFVQCGWWLRILIWSYIVLGWIITTLTVAGFTGLIRKT